MGSDTAGGRAAEATLRIGRYRVEAVIGTGGFATVYRAVDERLDDTVAVKVLAENHSLDPDLRERFLTEGRVLRRVASPHVVTVYDLGETDRQQPYLVLEFADRGTLGQRVPDLLTRGWRPGAADVRAVAEPLAEALAAVHRAGVVHRDLNPANVLLTTRGPQVSAAHGPVTAWDERLVLVDLGLCKDLARNSGHTSAGGTEGFRPPELRRGPAVIDERADLWSLSAVVVWLVTGAPPRDAPARTALAGTGLPPGLARALDRSLAVDPEARHPDVHAWWAEVAAALAAPAVGLPGGAAARAPVSLAPQPPVVGGGWTSPGAGPIAPFGPGAGGAVGAGRPLSARGWGWRLLHSAWVAAALLAGLTTWVGFLYVGLRAERRPWLWASGVYAAAAVLIIVLAMTSPAGPDGSADVGAWQSVTGMTLLLVTWFGGFAHALVANTTWLRWRSQRSR